jgi:hypothetical protein
VAGTGRSGTTWLAEVICYGRGCRLIFEPFDPGRVRLCRGFLSKQYLRPDDRRPEYLEPARRLVTGQVRSRWTDRFHESFLARRRVIKDIRANLLLGWLHANFPEMPVVLLIRHPCAVAASRLSLGWRDNLADVLSQRELLEDHLAPFEAEMRRARTPFERHIFLWCVDNYVPLRQFAPGEVGVFFYENLLTNPNEELRRLFSFLGGSPGVGVRRALERPSPVSRRGGVGDWRRLVSPAQRERAFEILSLFGMEGVYGEGETPDADTVRRLMAQRMGSAGGR